MSPRVRLRVWAGVVAACLVSMMMVALGVHADWLLLAALGALVQGLGVAVIVRLLVTTPEDAIKLKPLMSWVLLTAGAAVNCVSAASFQVPVLVGLAVLVYGAIMRLKEISPWWVAVLVWSPGWVGTPLALADPLERREQLAFLAVLCVVWTAVFLLLVSNRNMRGLRRFLCPSRGLMAFSASSGIFAAWYLLIS